VTRRLAAVAWLTTVWMALWADLSWANLAGGVVVAFGVSGLVPPRHPVGPALGFRPLKALWLLVYFAGQLVQSSAQVAWEVLTPSSRIEPAVVSVELTTSAPAIATLVANLVSLTPGTLTLEIDEETSILYIHVLHLKSFESTRDLVLSFERLALKAFPERRRPAEAGGGR
jgi:multicomponent Na+:H+ antiporter subunit E